MLNSVQIEGRLVRDPEPRSMPNGKTTLGFAIGCDRDYKGEDGRYVTDFIECVAFGRTAEQIAGHCKKASTIIVQGRLEQRKFTYKNGNPRNIHEVFVDKVYFLDRRASKDEEGGWRATKDEESEFAPVGMEDIPF